MQMGTLLSDFSSLTHVTYTEICAELGIIHRPTPRSEKGKLPTSATTVASISEIDEQTRREMDERLLRLFHS